MGRSALLLYLKEKWNKSFGLTFQKSNLNAFSWLKDFKEREGVIALCESVFSLRIILRGNKICIIL